MENIWRKREGRREGGRRRRDGGRGKLVDDRYVGKVRIDRTRNEAERGSYLRRVLNESTSFYFANLPNRVRIEELWRVFQRWGKVSDVFIPSKKDRYGKPFGFVRFTNVQNITELESKLQDVWLGNNKLLVNISRYNRNGTRAVVDGVTKEWKRMKGKRANNRSYAEVLAGTSKDNGEKEKERWNDKG